MKCVLTAGGLGTRLLPLTKEIPKEMLPIYDKGKNKTIILKPILQVIFESLYNYNIRDYCFIIRKSKSAVKNHFTPDLDMIKQLKTNSKEKIVKVLEDFYEKLQKSNITFSYQTRSIGFGDAIHKSKKFVGNNYFLLHAGDDIVISKNNSHFKRLESAFKKYNADIACLIEKVDDPSRYGVVNGSMLDKDIIDINEMEEKPKKPKSHNAIIAIYIFKPSIFKYLAEARKSAHPEKQLATAFNIAMNRNKRIIGVILHKDEKRIDVGTPESYAKVLVSLSQVK